MRVHLVDGTYELFRHHFGQPSRLNAAGIEVAATRGVVASVMSMLAGGVTHIGVATDHVITSFRNEMWPGYKTGEGVAEALLAQFEPLEVALRALGVTVWPMVEVEADDALASAALMAAADPAVDQVIICSPDKDLAQCVVGRRVVQMDRRSGVVTDEDGVRAKFGVDPASIPDWLGLVGDSADGFPGIAGWGRRSASAVLQHYRRLEAIPDSAVEWAEPVRRAVRGAAVLAERLHQQRGEALLFRQLARLRIDSDLVGDVDQLRWQGPTADFVQVCRELRDDALAERVLKLAN